MQNAVPIETREDDADAAEGGRSIRGMTSLTHSKMHEVPSAPEQPVLPRRSALLIEILAFVLIAFLVVSALLFNLTAPGSLVASQPAVSVQLPPAAVPAPSPVAPEAETPSTTALSEVQPQAGTDTQSQTDASAVISSPEPQVEVTALPPATVPGAPDLATGSVPPAPVEETVSKALSPDEIAALIRRGNELLGMGDIVAARSAYERAAAGGDRTAATGVAKTYDPIFLAQNGVRGLRGDPARAALWYAKAAAAGDRTAQQRLRQLRVQYPQ